MSDLDIEEVKQIEEECQISSWSLSDYKNEIGRENGLTFVAKEKNKVIGYIVARLITPPDLHLQFYKDLEPETKTIVRKQKLQNPETEAEIEIYNIAVKLHYQSRGFGQKLLDQIIACNPNLKSKNIWLEVRESNTKAIRFYEKNEFIKISKRRNFYNSPVENAILMKKSIKKF
jgi:ribosomal-protein-alanine N-acetyltransferase